MTTIGEPSLNTSIRKWPRYRVDIPVLVTAQRPVKTATCHGRGSELNGGGLAVEVATELVVEDQVEIEFTPPHSSEPVTFRCFVRNRNGNRYGLEFIAENDLDYVNTGELQEGLAAMAAGSAPSQ
jgi:PilZ domain